MSTSKVSYGLGHSESELQRLGRQASVVAPITRRLFRDAGLSRDMRVLDVGCGTGDVSMLVADMVGPGGSVVAIDFSKDALAVARERTREAGYDNIEFRESSAEEFKAQEPFDFAIGRYVLMHQPDPAAFIRSVAAHVRPGGVVAFHEAGLHDKHNLMTPPHPLISKVYDWLITAFQSFTPHPDAVARMVEHFHNAGVRRSPTLFCEIPTGAGPDSPIYGWFAHTVRTLMPQIEKIGAATAEQIDIETMEDRIRSVALDSHAQIMAPLQYCAWARL